MLPTGHTHQQCKPAAAGPAAKPHYYTRQMFPTVSLLAAC